MTLSNQQIFDLLKPTLDALNVRLFSHTVLLERAPFGPGWVEISNEQPTGSEQDHRITNTTQIFVITLRLRLKKPGTEEVNRQKTIEDAILAKLEATQLAGSILFTEDKIWKRPASPIKSPVLHYQSTLRVLVNDITSTTGDGQVLARSTLKIGTDSALDAMQLLDKPARNSNETFTNRREDTLTRKGIARTGDTDSFFATIEYTDARYAALKTIWANQSKEACVFTRPSGPSNFNGQIVNISNPAQFANIEEITIQIEVIP